MFLDRNFQQKGGNWLLLMDEKNELGCCDLIIKMFKINITWAYFPTCVNAHAWHNCANGGGEGSKIIFENFQKTENEVLIVCSSYINVSQSPIMYHWRYA